MTPRPGSRHDLSGRVGSGRLPCHPTTRAMIGALTGREGRSDLTRPRPARALSRVHR